MKKSKIFAMILFTSIILCSCGNVKKTENGSQSNNAEAQNQDGSSMENIETQQPKEHHLVECKADIDEKAYELYVSDSEARIKKMQTEDDVCDKVIEDEDLDTGYRDSFAHKNFDSYKLYGVAVTPVNYEHNNNTVNMIYELHFGAHGEVTTYCAVVYFDVYTNIDKIGSGDIMCTVCDVGEYQYFGSPTALDLVAEMKDDWKVDGEILIETP